MLEQRALIMGNLCGNGKGMSTSSRPPRDLNTLLCDLDHHDLDRDPWAKAFREHLRILRQPDLEALLQFVSLANLLRLKGEEARRSRWKAADIDRERIAMLKGILEDFFGEDAATPVALSNQVLREELWEALNSLKEHSDHLEVEAAYELVWQARCDYKVWKGGIDRAYNAFLATKPSSANSLTAVIMSIL